MISLVSLLSGLLSAKAKAMGTRRRQETELRSMGTRELADLGIGASQIPYLFHHGKTSANPGQALPARAEIIQTNTCLTETITLEFLQGNYRQ